MVKTDVLNLKVGFSGRRSVSCLEATMRGMKNTCTSLRHNELSRWKDKQSPFERATDENRATFVNSLTVGMCMSSGD